MPNRRNKDVGDSGEIEVVQKVKCPNCGKDLRRMPESYPMIDVECTGCFFKAQVKTSNSKPKGIVLGATWDVMDKNLKAGHISPPLFLNFKWYEEGKKKQEIRFYPFISRKDNFQKYYTKIKNPARELWMFRYIGLNKTPFYTIYKK